MATDTTTTTTTKNNNDYIDHLINLANDLTQTSLLPNKEKVKPNFPLPPPSDVNDVMYLEEKNNQKGWYAKRPLQAGTILLISKPLGMVMNWDEDEDDKDEEDEEDDDDDEEPKKGSKRNGLLILNLLNKIQKDPKLWLDKLSTLYPRDLDTALSLPKWTCEDESVNADIATSIEKLKKKENDHVVTEIEIRLPLIVRYNCLSVETSPELFIHPNPAQGGHVNLSGTALYHYPSFFNHSSSKTNVVRFAIGDIMFFVVTCGGEKEVVEEKEELCISYIEHEMLMENVTRRNLLLDMDFCETENDDGTTNDDAKKEKTTKKEKDDEDEDDDDDGPPNYPMIDTDIQQELINTYPYSERISSIQELISQAQKDDWYQCDIQNLNMILAMTYDAMGHFEEALKLWLNCVEFGTRFLPVLDEGVIVLCVQTALCARALSIQQQQQQEGNDDDDDDNDESRKYNNLAEKYEKLALQKHSLLYGDGVARFRKRYEKEIDLHLRKEVDMEGNNKKRKKGELVPQLRGQIAMDALWPME